MKDIILSKIAGIRHQNGRGSLNAAIDLIADTLADLAAALETKEEPKAEEPKAEEPKRRPSRAKGSAT